MTLDDARVIVAVVVLATPVVLFIVYLAAKLVGYGVARGRQIFDEDTKKKRDGTYKPRR